MSLKSDFRTFHWQLLTTFLGLAGLFFILTNGIPLIQMGLMSELSSKTRYVNMMRMGVALLAVPLLFLRWKCPEVFRQLWFVRLIQGLKGWSFWVFVSLVFLLYSGMTISVGWIRHLALETRAFDLGIFDQAVWNTMQGHFLYSSIKDGICLLGDHMSPILLVATPFYLIWPDPRMLLILQALATASCVFLIGKIAKERTGDYFLAFVFVIAYFFFLPSRNALHEDFHPEVLAEPFIFLAFIFLEKRKWTGFLLTLGVVILAKENMLAVAFMLGLYAVSFKKAYRLGLSVMIFAALLFWAEVSWIIPKLSQKPYLYQGFYVYLMNSPLGILKVIFSGDTWEYILKVYSPLMFLSFFHFPTWMLTLPILTQNLLSENPVMRSFAYHYTAGLTPFVFISAIYGFQRLTEKYNWFHRYRYGVAAGLMIVSLLRSGPSEYYYYWQSAQHNSPRRQYIRFILKDVPQEASVLTHNNFIPQLAHRKEIYQFDYNAVPTKAEIAKQKQADYVIFDREFWEPNSRGLPEELTDLMKAGYFLIHEEDDFYVMTEHRIMNGGPMQLRGVSKRS
ncbi:MAG: DUF2079 domain-containing protein [Candidatus Omnitrophica bacterium]|nr:DUF2079 domain-containing protein [Candidatus Omnitrophota bacterium]